jgi:hypothetical protein
MNDSVRSLKTIIGRCILVVILAVAFGYIEAAVVVYLREIFHPGGFQFPLNISPLTTDSRNLLLVEVGRESATIVLILTAAILSGRNRPQRLAFFMIIFAVWDIFYYVWLKVILGWPVSVMDWDILFLIPAVWAGPVLAPMVVSLILLAFAGFILYRDWMGKPVKANLWDWLGFFLAGIIVAISFCIAGRHCAQPDYAAYFPLLVYVTGLLMAVVLFSKCLLRR